MGIILILKVSVVLVIVSPAINYEDEFLRSYKPNPFLPRKLNEFYASIQNHKDEFRQIRELAKRNINRNELKRNNILPNEFSYINQFNTMENNNDFNLESRPSNDIYPYMYRKSNPEHNLRFRRNLRVHINNEAKYGDISSNSRKYPDRFQQKRGEDQDTDDLQVEKYNYEIINSPPIVEPRRPVLIDKEDESIIDQFVKDRKKPLLIKIMHKGNQGKFQTPRHVNYNSLSNNHVNELEDNSWDNYASEHENQKVDQNGSSKILKDLLDTNAKEPFQM
ncbi:inactive protein tyrosine kinase pTKL-like [Aethina tumida]|uniref:inactive protein tyrosine kinase pTKL-like n=1 Tax=Aethina tumida TaxID=116153 RepID=UPI002147EAB4|nr:inactive protein tyrosine kinase pTKL-like [Aethina tumida]